MGPGLAVTSRVYDDELLALLNISFVQLLIRVTITNDRVGYITDEAGYDTPTFASTASPLQRGYAEPAIVDDLIEMMNIYQRVRHRSGRHQ